jgi:hypothetical protein
MSPIFDFVPFAAASYLVSQGAVYPSMSAVGLPPPPGYSAGSFSVGGTSESPSENYGEVIVGAGFVVNRTLTLQPSVSIPVGLEGPKTSFQIVFAFNFGSSPARK